MTIIKEILTFCVSFTDSLIIVQEKINFLFLIVYVKERICIFVCTISLCIYVMRLNF